MKVLFDEMVDYRHARALPGHEVYSVGYLGWKGTPDPELVQKALEHGFHAIATTNENDIKHVVAQRNLPIYVHEFDVPKGVRGPHAVFDCYAAQMPEILERLNELPRSREHSHAQGADEQQTLETARQRKLSKSRGRAKELEQDLDWELEL